MNEPDPFQNAFAEPAPCDRCGAIVPGGRTGCHALFAELNSLEYTDINYGAVNLLSVDAHALQHPEDHGIKNNAFHLIRLCWLLEHGGDPAIGQGPAWLASAFEGPVSVPEIAPPIQRGRMTVTDVVGAGGPRDHAERVYLWARSVWEAWHEQHEWARKQIKSLRGGRRPTKRRR